MHEINFQMFTGQSIISIHFIFAADLLCQPPESEDYFTYMAIVSFKIQDWSAQ